MRSARTAFRIAAGATLLALALYGILAAPGLLTDNANSVPERTLHQAAR